MYNKTTSLIMRDNQVNCEYTNVVRSTHAFSYRKYTGVCRRFNSITRRGEIRKTFDFCFPCDCDPTGEI